MLQSQRQIDNASFVYTGCTSRILSVLLQIFSRFCCTYFDILSVSLCGRCYIYSRILSVLLHIFENAVDCVAYICKCGWFCCIYSRILSVVLHIENPNNYPCRILLISLGVHLAKIDPPPGKKKTISTPPFSKKIAF